MPASIDPKMTSLPRAQQDLWPHLQPTKDLGFVLYGGTAVALHLGHRISIDFDFFRTAPLKKAELSAFAFMADAQTIQEDINTVVVLAASASGPVKLSFFGGLAWGRVNDPLQTRDGAVLVASPEDLLATKLKAILDRAEAKDYLDISALLSGGVPLDRSLGAFAAMFGKDPGLPLRAMGYFKDGDLPSLPPVDQDRLRTARDAVTDIPVIKLMRGLSG